MREQWKPESQGMLCRLCRDLLKEVQSAEAKSEFDHFIRREPFHDERSAEEALRLGCSICNAIARQWGKLDNYNTCANKLSTGMERLSGS